MSERTRRFAVGDEVLVASKTALTPLSSVGSILRVTEVDGCVSRMSDGYWYPNFCLQYPPEAGISPEEVEKMRITDHWRMYQDEKKKNAELMLEVARLKKELEVK